MIEKLFGIEIVSYIKNKETPDEPEQTTKENVLKLSCHIDTNTTPVNHLNEGLKLSLEGDIEKQSPLLGRNCIYYKKSLINRLVSIHSC